MAILKVQNIGLFDYFNTEDKSKIDYAIINGNFLPKDVFNFGELIELKFGFIKDLIDYFYAENLNFRFTSILEIINLKYERPAADHAYFNNTPIFDIMMFKEYIENQLQTILTLEKTTLTSSVSVADLNAGAEIFDKLGSFAQVERLAKTYSLTVQQVRNMSYDDGYALLLTMHLENEFKRNLQKQQQRKKS